MKKKSKIIKILYYLTFLFLLSVIIISSIGVINWLMDNKKIEKQSVDINNLTEVKEVKDNEKTEVINNEEEKSKSDPYWDFIKMNLIDVNFDKLLKENNETVGFIKVNGTNVNYPFVQTTDNEYYLNHSFTKEKNSAGWVFLDYRNNIKTYDQNNIIYAHGRVNNTMFGSLNSILTNGWVDKEENHIIRLSTLYDDTLWQVFSVYHIQTTNDYTKTNYMTEEGYQSFLDMIKNRSAHDFNTNVTTKDKILTLSTCYNKNERMVVHAKLIKKQHK